MKNSIRILTVLTLILFGTYSHAKESIKIAIVDNFKYQKYVTTGRATHINSKFNTNCSHIECKKNNQLNNRRYNEFAS